MIQLTSTLSYMKFYVAPSQIATVEPWSPALSGHTVCDPMDAIPERTQTLIRLNCGLILPVTEDAETIMNHIMTRQSTAPA